VGYTCEEIGKIAGIKTGVVMTRVFRARKKLRAILEDDDSDESEKVIEI